MDVLKNKMVLVLGAAASIAAYFLGDYWYLFVAFLALNVVDYLTGTLRARKTGTESSVKGRHGIRKKVGDWVVIGIAFFVSTACVDLGETVHLDLRFLELMGYFTLATFIINEIRSILENTVQMGSYVPPFLSKGLETVSKMLRAEEDSTSGKPEDQPDNSTEDKGGTTT